MDHDEIYLDTYLLQQDMMVRLPKSALSNLGAEKGKTKFDIYFDCKNHSLVLKIHTEEKLENGQRTYCDSPFTKTGDMD